MKLTTKRKFINPGMVEFNLDLYRNYPAISSAPPVRAEILIRALTANVNRYELFRQAVTLTRAIHNPRQDRFQVSINRSLRMLAGEAKKPVTVTRKKKAVAA